VIEAYMTPDDKLPEVARDYRRTMRNTFDEYAQLAKAARGRVPRSFERRLAQGRAERLGIKPQTVQESGGRAFSVLEIWQGLRIRYGGAKQKVIPSSTSSR